ncbi:MAG: S-adenosylmethionine:tRNA ribosyltransferase-isomerase [Flavobacteriales bacterium]|nr:S-adenosylmethionine:tRNA ribosyltransferase-isomerase [Flavobacteriales bacterium]
MDSSNISDFDYHLPEELIAQRPLEQRSDARLLVFEKGKILDRKFSELPELLPDNTQLVLNNTQVINARIIMFRESGARVELFLLAPLKPKSMEEAMISESECIWTALVGGGKRWKEGESLSLDADGLKLSAKRLVHHGTHSEVAFSWDEVQGNFGELLEKLGRVPLPPYMNREVEEADPERYQTTYAEIQGSVAAPTAGLHYTKEILEEMRSKGISLEKVTLHVGAGTFKPVSSESFKDHDMHSEHISVQRSTIEALAAHKGLRVAVGTTSLRTLESLYWLAVAKYHGRLQNKVEQWDPYELEDVFSSYSEALNYLLEQAGDASVLNAATALMIVPSYSVKSIDGITTNFHLPKSTLLLLVSAMIGEDWLRVYEHATANRYRFLSYGDTSLLWKNK